MVIKQIAFRTKGMVIACSSEGGLFEYCSDEVMIKTSILFTTTQTLN